MNDRVPDGHGQQEPKLPFPDEYDLMRVTDDGLQATCLTFFERVMVSGASLELSANGTGPAWLVVWKARSAWRRSSRSP